MLETLPPLGSNTSNPLTTLHVSSHPPLCFTLGFLIQQLDVLSQEMVVSAAVIHNLLHHRLHLLDYLVFTQPKIR